MDLVHGRRPHLPRRAHTSLPRRSVKSLRVGEREPLGEGHVEVLLVICEPPPTIALSIVGLIGTRAEGGPRSAVPDSELPRSTACIRDP